MQGIFLGVLMQPFLGSRDTEKGGRKVMDTMTKPYSELLKLDTRGIFRKEFLCHSIASDEYFSLTQEKDLGTWLSLPGG